jgi:hypothetical protein
MPTCTQLYKFSVTEKDSGETKLYCESIHARNAHNISKKAFFDMISGKPFPKKYKDKYTITRVRVPVEKQSSEHMPKGSTCLFHDMIGDLPKK